MSKKLKNPAFLLWVIFAIGALILSTTLIDVAVSEARSKPKEVPVEEFKTHLDSGMLVNGEGRTYLLVLEKQHQVSFQVTGSGGNVDCAVYDDKNRQVKFDNDPKDGCNITFVPETLGKYAFVVHNSSEDVERFSASIVY